MYKYSFRLPPYYTLLVRSLSVLEGIALASDPNYKVGGVFGGVFGSGVVCFEGWGGGPLRPCSAQPQRAGGNFADQ